MSESPVFPLILFAGAIYVFKLWRDDLLAAKAGSPNDRALPGAATAPRLAIWIAVIGAVFLVAVETGGELILGVSTEQTDIAAIALLSMIGAGVLEEILFRGYLVVQNRGRVWLIASIVGFSLLFSMLHYQYYTHVETFDEKVTLTLLLDSKAAWSLLLLFMNSLWFYFLRFSKWNPSHSLLPCFAAHIASNLAVFIVKLAQGHVTSFL